LGAGISAPSEPVPAGVAPAVDSNAPDPMPPATKLARALLGA